jgi:outer membrane protein assembly factor BamD
MKIGYMKYWLFFAISAVFLVACKSEFERIRTSNDPVMILERAHQLYEEEEWLKAQTLYDVVIPYYRGKAEAEKVFYRYAYTYYNMGDYILASHYFSSFANSFINSPNREEAAYMSAYSEYQLSPMPALDQSYTVKAIESLQLFINKFPNSERVTTCNALIDELRLKLEEKAYNQGILYYNLRQYVSAVTSFQNMLKDFPETKRAEEVNFLMVKASFKYAENSILEKRKERLDKTMEHYQVFNRKFPGSQYEKEASRIKQETEKLLKSLKNG